MGSDTTGKSLKTYFGTAVCRNRSCYQNSIHFYCLEIAANGKRYRSIPCLSIQFQLNTESGRGRQDVKGYKTNSTRPNTASVSTEVRFRASIHMHTHRIRLTI